MDVRVIVIGGVAVASMQRINENDFRSNVGQGGRCVKVELSPRFRQVAERCASILGLDYCGVDLLYGDDEEPIVCEVNSNAFIGGIESATGVMQVASVNDGPVTLILDTQQLLEAPRRG